MIQYQAATARGPCIDLPVHAPDAGLKPRRTRSVPSGRVLSACILLPLWLGWVFGSLWHMRGSQMLDARAEAEALAADIRRRLGSSAFASGPVLVALSGHRCNCARGGDDARWTTALREAGGTHVAVDAPGASFSALVFDTHGALRLAASPAAAGCTGDPARLLDTALAPSTAPVAPFVSACVC